MKQNININQLLNEIGEIKQLSAPDNLFNNCIRLFQKQQLQRHQLRKWNNWIAASILLLLLLNIWVFTKNYSNIQDQNNKKSQQLLQKYMGLQTNNI